MPFLTGQLSSDIIFFHMNDDVKNENVTQMLTDNNKFTFAFPKILVSESVNLNVT